MDAPLGFYHPWKPEQLWQIHYVPALWETGSPCDGICDYENREILINVNLLAGGNEEELRLTLVHEGWHSKSRWNRGHMVKRKLDDIIRDVLKIQDALGMLKW